MSDSADDMGALQSDLAGSNFEALIFRDLQYAYERELDNQFIIGDPWKWKRPPANYVFIKPFLLGWPEPIVWLRRRRWQLKRWVRDTATSGRVALAERIGGDSLHDECGDDW